MVLTGAQEPTGVPYIPPIVERKGPQSGPRSGGPRSGGSRSGGSRRGGSGKSGGYRGGASRRSR